VNHRIVSGVVTLIVATLFAVALMFAWVIDVRSPAAGTGAAQPIPHPVAGEASACGGCHTLDEDSLPLTHRFYDWETCEGCHELASPALVPHSVSIGTERCPLCHGDPKRDLGMPLSHLGYPKDQCLFCHPPDESKSDRTPEPAGESVSPRPSVTHGVGGAFDNCLYCHKIDGTPPMPESHWAFELQTCLWCHPKSATETTVTPRP